MSRRSRNRKRNREKVNYNPQSKVPKVPKVPKPKNDIYNKLRILWS